VTDSNARFTTPSLATELRVRPLKPSSEAQHLATKDIIGAIPAMKTGF
jgi:hypothetical protein